jgi:single-stranded DNA-specific DHH superfamily exonuclease
VAIQWDEVLDAAEDTGKDVLSVLKPYLPALSREGKDVYEGFIKHLRDGDFTEIDKLMYVKMTPSERKELEEEVYKDAFKAAEAKYRQKELMKDILLKIVVRLALKAATAGIV